MDIFSFASGGSINLIKAEITAADGSKHTLGHKENELLRLLLNKAPDVVDKNTITEQVWQRPVISESAISVTIAKLRKLLKLVSETDIEIITAKGVGYRLALAPEVSAVSIGEASSNDSAEVNSERGISSKEELLSPEERTALQELQNPAEDELDWEKVDQASEFDQRASSRQHYLKIGLLVFLICLSLGAALYLNWAYHFTQCRSLSEEEQKELGLAVSVDQMCWSEISERKALKQLSLLKEGSLKESSLKTSLSKKSAWLVLIDKEGRVKAYSEDGEIIK
ncbi:transcriptional regulator [Litoribrevibacter euphylliae]|uniref:Transcriptional regulator n=1 Tax=Litoribrevibacter euphylliae TaxID=1834034 RepID=A0ABV7HBI3_9GAMM